MVFVSLYRKNDDWKLINASWNGKQSNTNDTHILNKSFMLNWILMNSYVQFNWTFKS